MVVERAFGLWKRRFPCLSRGLGLRLITSTTVVVACAILHNMALEFNDELPEDDFGFEEIDVNDPEPPHWQPLDGFAVREDLIRKLFGE